MQEYRVLLVVQFFFLKPTYTKILVGASLSLAFYTGLLYQGPNIVKVITNEIDAILKKKRWV